MQLKRLALDSLVSQFAIACWQVFCVETLFVRFSVLCLLSDDGRAGDKQDAKNNDDWFEVHIPVIETRRLYQHHKADSLLKRKLADSAYRSQHLQKFRKLRIAEFIRVTNRFYPK